MIIETMRNHDFFGAAFRSTVPRGPMKAPLGVLERMVNLTRISDDDLSRF